jgi:hypothetical protein
MTDQKRQNNSPRQAAMHISLKGENVLQGIEYLDSITTGKLRTPGELRNDSYPVLFARECVVIAIIRCQSFLSDDIDEMDLRRCYYQELVEIGQETLARDEHTNPPGILKEAELLIKLWKDQRSLATVEYHTKKNVN